MRHPYYRNTKLLFPAFPLLALLLVTTLSANAQLRIPNFTEVGGTQLTNTHGQWVRIDPAQPNNIDLVESRLFKMPRKGDGVEAIEFKLVGGDGGTAWYKNSEHNHFANGGRGGDLNFTLDFRSYTNQTYYGKPFIATFGKKGESVTFGQSFYVAAGGGGSTALAWLMPDMVLKNVYRTRTTLSGYYDQGGGYFISGGLIASAGGGSGGFATVLRGVHGASAWFSDESFPPQNHDAIDASLGLNSWWDNAILFTQVAGGSVTRNDAFDGLNPSNCCTVDLMARNATGIVHNAYNVLYENGVLQSIKLGQEGGKPTVIWRSNQSSGSPTYERGGMGSTFKIIGGGNTQISVVKNGGRGGAGWTGGGAGISTTDFFGSLNQDNEALLPTSGAGGTGSFAQGSYPRDNRRPGMPGWNVFSRLLENTGTNLYSSTNTPQSGYIMYRTISETTPPEIRMTAMTVNLGNGTITPNGYNPVVSFSTAIAPYLMKDDGIWDNDGIASVTATVNGQPFTQFECYMARPGAGPIPVYITATDGAGNSVDGLIMVTVRDPFVPVPQMEFGPPGDLERPYRIDVSNGPVTLTAANFPVPFDGCKSSANVELHFTSTTFYCNDAGHRPVQYYYTDSDGNTSPVYTKTFVVQCNGSTPGNQRYVYVDEAATGANDGTSWGNAFHSLKDALNVPRVSAIYVAQGTYRPTTESDRDARFEPAENAKIYGGFPTGGADFAARNPEAYPTILSGEIGDAGILTDNSRHIMVITRNNVHVEGFTIRDGYSSEGERGVGIWIGATETTLPTDFKTVVRNCKFLNNNAGTSNGGAIYTHYRNTTHTNYLYVQNCLFDGNTANNGGAVFLENYTALPNTIQEFTNCVFNNNTASQSGGGLSVQQSTEAKLVNCTFGGNTAVSGGAIYNNGTVRLHNGIVHSNSGSIANSGTFQADYSNIQGSGGSSSWSLSGIQDLGHNIDADPLFAASPALSIRKGSPSANTGLNSYNTEPYDIRGNRRIHMSTIDMGAYETENFAVFVAADAPAGGDGTSWATAFNNLHDGIAAAGTGPDTKDVWIKAGTYRPSRRPGYTTTTPGSRDNSFYINAPIKIYGGFAGTESSTMERNIGQNPTILSGDINTPDDASDNTYHVLTLHTDEARLDGLIIEGGNANDGQDANKRIGGGVFQYGVGRNHVITNSVLRNNHATDRGGAVFLNANSQGSSDFVQCLFYGNTASRGAAVNMYNANGSGHYTLNFYQITAYNNTSSAAGAGAFEASQLVNDFPVRLHFYNSLLTGDMPQNYNNTGNILLNNTFISVSADGVFANTSNIAGADSKIMTADDGLRPGISSPAVSFGNEAHLGGIDKDITGSPRIIHKVDAGAYESPYYEALAADANGIIYVKPVATGEGTGKDWENATADLHNAIHSYNVQKVFVAVGTYKVGAHSFIMKNGVEIYGGFDPANDITDLSHSRIMPNPANNAIPGTVLDGEFTRPVVWNVFTEPTALNNSAVLDGFMLMNGKHPTGGGVRNIHASPTLRNVVINQNRATLKGAGIYNDHSSPKLINTVINNNGIDARFNPDVVQNIYGAGMYSTGSSAPVLTNVTLAANFLLIPANGSTMNGAGIYNENSSLSIRNSILWQNRLGFNTTMAGSDIANAGGTVSVQHSITQEYDTGNEADHNLVNTDPQLENIGAKDFRLLAVSPAIDAGSNALYTGLNSDTKDLAGKTRVRDFAGNVPIDMGAYEFQCVLVDYSGMKFESKTVIYDGNPHSIAVQNLPPEISVSYEMRDGDWEIVENLTATDAGFYFITATMTPNGADGDCEPYVRTATLTIQKAPSIITADETQSFVYDGTAKSVTATLSHTDAALTYSPQQTYTEMGVYPVTVSVPATANYAAASKMVNLVIEKDNFTTITLDDAVFQFDGTPKSLAITGTLPTGATVVYGGNGRTRPGVYTVNAFIQLENYNDLWLEATMTIEGVDIVADAGGIVYVKPIGTGTKDGSSWVNATADLQGAIDAATQVLVASGNYDVPTPHSFVMKEGVKIYGGFNPVDNITDWDTRTLPNKTLGDGSVLNGKNERPVVWNVDNGLTSTAILDGFTLMNGEGFVGAVYNRNVSPVFNNLVIRDNTSTVGGGGMYNDSAPITLINSVIKDNTAEYGGGIRNNNSASKLTNVIITGNSATMATTGAGGGGIFNQASAIELTNVLIADNSTNFQGGGFRNLSGNPVFTNVTMANNTAVNNAATTAMDVAGGVPQLHNTIVFGTIGGNFATQSSMIDDNTSGARVAATHTITDVFTDPANGNYTLKTGSPATNAGDNTLYPNLNTNPRDLAGNPRLVGTAIDQGAYESPDGALPVRWISFEGRLSDRRQAVLTWKTVETNVSHYEVERSNNAKDFRIAGTVMSDGTGSGSYSLTDPEPVSAAVYYRIRQVDLDGTFSYSRIISLTSSGSSGLLVWPNPAREQVTVQLGPGYTGSKVRLISPTGIVLEQTEVKDEVFIIDIRHYIPGIYLLQTYDGKTIKLVRE